MKIKLLIPLLLAGILFSCSDNSSDQNKSESPTDSEFGLSKAEYYQMFKDEFAKEAHYRKQMTEKNYSLTQNGPCDDALLDTLYQSYTPYIETKEIHDSSAVITFKFKDSCCQEFSGDYSIANDTLRFEYEPLGDLFCSCMCWYRYKLTINNPEETFSEVIIVEKED